MIAFLSGNIKFIFDDSCIIDVHGVGYKVFIDSQTRQTLTLGTDEELFIHTAVSENAITLYGMKDKTAFELFEILLSVNGIGAKSALAIVSNISAADFARAVALQDIKTLTRLPGIGKKSAERILLELKDKIQSFSMQSAQIKNAACDEAAEALGALGYTAAEIAKVFDSAPPNYSTEQLIKFALTRL